MPSLTRRASLVVRLVLTVLHAQSIVGFMGWVPPGISEMQFHSNGYHGVVENLLSCGGGRGVELIRWQPLPQTSRLPQTWLPHHPKDKITQVLVGARVLRLNSA